MSSTSTAFAEYNGCDMLNVYRHLLYAVVPDYIFQENEQERRHKQESINNVFQCGKVL